MQAFFVKQIIRRQWGTFKRRGNPAVWFSLKMCSSLIHQSSACLRTWENRPFVSKQRLLPTTFPYMFFAVTWLTSGSPHVVAAGSSWERYYYICRTTALRSFFVFFQIVMIYQALHIQHGVQKVGMLCKTETTIKTEQFTGCVNNWTL